MYERQYITSALFITQLCSLRDYFSFSFGCCFAKKKKVEVGIVVGSLTMNICFANNNFLPCFFAFLHTHVFPLHVKPALHKPQFKQGRVQRAITNFEYVGSTSYNDHHLAARDNDMPFL